MKYIKKIPLFICALLLTLTVHADNTNKKNVILFMWDGVRWDEFFQGTDSRITHKKSEQIFTNFWNDILKRGGRVYGDPEKKSSVLVSNPVIFSLPAYQNIFAGFPTTCLTNMCQPTHFETFAEKLVKDHRYDPHDVAVISSWKKIAYAVEKDEGTIFVNSGRVPLHMDYDGSGLDPVHESINAQEAVDPPRWHNARLDKYTFAHGLEYIQKQKPRFLFLSLDNSDEYGHLNEYRNYVTTLKTYDEYLKQLVNLLESMGDYGKNTTLIVTTDHGRGRNPIGWQEHGPGFSYARNIFLYERNFGKRYDLDNTTTQVAEDDDRYTYITHNDIRPYIEKILGVKDASNDNVIPFDFDDISEAINTPYRR